MSDVYAAVTAIAEATSFSVVAICESLGVSRSAYYAWRDGEASPREQALQRVTPRIVEIFWHHKRRYGTRRIESVLQDEGITFSEKRIRTVLKTQSLRAIQPKSFVPKTTASRHHLGYNPNLLIDDPRGTTPAGPVDDTGRSHPDRVWVGDITYLPLTGGRFVYLAGLMDLFTRDLVGWHVMTTMDEDLVTVVLQNAIRERQPKPQLIHHTDRGGQYAAKGYRAILQRATMRQSMSRADNCYDNAFMESCWGSFKTELQMDEYESVEQAKSMIAEYVRYYRFERKHSSLGYQTPQQFTRSHLAKLTC